MSKFGWVIIFILMAGSSYAQDYFIFIQAENHQPFYVRIGNQVYSSSAGGHLILSRLKDSTYDLTLGLPGQGTREQRYVLNIRQKDQEFTLREQGLYDEQAKEMKTPERPAGNTEEIHPLGIKKDDAFSRLMAGVVHDTAVLYNTYAMEKTDSPALVIPKPAPDTTLRIAAAPVVDTTAVHPPTAANYPPTAANHPPGDSIVSTTAAPVAPPPIPMPVPPKPDTLATATTAPGMPPVSKPDSAKPRPRTVVKLSERKLARSVRLAYADRSAGKKADTVIIFIPVDTAVTAPLTHTVHPDSPGIAAAHPPSEPAHPAPDTPRKAAVTKPSVPFINSDCRNFATDYDVDKLRVKLLETPKDDDRILAARKVFKTRCFTTRQIRSLTEVFTTDAAKFRFLETAYPFCSDDQFRELSGLLADPVYIGKFRAMTGH